MTPPTQIDYADAVQSPHLCFLDPALRSGVVETDPFGMPIPYSGGSAIVFRVAGADGASWAVRCFHRLPEDMARRYRAISKAIDKARLPFLVPVDFRDDGIRVNGKLWPITKMRWVDGATLSKRLEENRHPDEIRRLRLKFEEVVVRLRAAGIAHGDLMPDNIVVTNDGGLVLVDYDDMYVPEMAGWIQQRGLGHRNFQHPGRSRATGDSRLDDFSAMVIWSALLILERHPDWWERFESEEKALLFQAADFDRPDRSALFRAIKQDPELRWIAEQLAIVAAADIDQVPSFVAFKERDIPQLAPALDTDYVPIASPPLLDLRRDDPGAIVGSLARVVGEVLNVRRGTTRYGDPYLFVDLGTSHGVRIRLVMWAEVLAKVPAETIAALEDGGMRLVRASGLITSFRGTPRIEIDSPRQLALLDPREAARLLGSPWRQAPPPWPRLSEPRVGDRVHHDKFGFGLVLRVLSDVVEVDFGGTTREIAYDKYFLGLVDRVQDSPEPRKLPKPKGATATPDRRSSERMTQPRPTREETPARVSRDSSKRVSVMPTLSRHEADRLDALYRDMASLASSRRAPPAPDQGSPRDAPAPPPSNRGRPGTPAQLRRLGAGAAASAAVAATGLALGQQAGLLALSPDQSNWLVAGLLVGAAVTWLVARRA
ncbi:MAG TPA: hypothetical protein VNO86_06610 [Candidatus Binatia bacterium]|nr:hypothetical protein [Candidatus Binatia bacterium]